MIDKPQLTFYEAGRGMADADDVMFGERGLSHSLAVNERAIVTAEINDLVLRGCARSILEPEVPAGGMWGFLPH